jgi:predicted dehydrogenase
MVKKLNKNSVSTPVSLVAIGAGNRMCKYLHYVELHPQEVKVIAVVEPDEIRRNRVAKMFNIDAGHCFGSYDAYFASGVKADVAFICTPENEHFKPCMQAIAQGYHVLLEKPIAQSLDECTQIAEAAKKANVIIGVCHVMRYHPYFMKIKEIIDSGTLGDVISVTHQAGVGIDRYAHCFVRGLWRKAESTNPFILAKCCHDVDFLLWILGSKCHQLSSFGSLRHFTAANAPAGSAERCVNCSVEKTCPYSAVNLYWRRRDWISNFDVPQGKTIEDAIKNELNNGAYGRCVFHCDNDVVDNQVLSMELKNHTTVNMTIAIFTQDDSRKTRISCADGEIVGDEKHLDVYHFNGSKKETYDFTESASQPFHAGSDLKIVEEFIHAVIGVNEGFKTAIDQSIESHRVCFEAERSRLTGKTITMD